MMDKDVAASGHELIDLLNEQCMLYRRLRDLTRRQTEIIDQTNPQQLLKILGDRQRLIDSLTQISRRLAPLRQEWSRIFNSLPVEQRQEVQRLVGDTQSLLGEIMSRDRQDAARLKEAQGEVAREIKSVQVGRHVNRAYTRTMAPPRRSLDIAD